MNDEDREEKECVTWDDMVADLEERLATEVIKSEMYREQYEGLKKCHRMACELNAAHEKLLHEWMTRQH